MKTKYPPLAEQLRMIEKDILRVLQEAKHPDPAWGVLPMTESEIYAHTKLFNLYRVNWEIALNNLVKNQLIESYGKAGYKLIRMLIHEEKRERENYVSEVKKYVGTTEWYFNTTPLTK